MSSTKQRPYDVPENSVELDITLSLHRQTRAAVRWLPASANQALSIKGVFARDVLISDVDCPVEMTFPPGHFRVAGGAAGGRLIFDVRPDDCGCKG